MDLAEIDLLDRDRFTAGIPHEWFTYLRNTAPIYRHPEPAGPGFWVFTKHDDVTAIGRDAKHFSSDQARGGVVGLEEPEVPVDFEQGGNLMLTMDPPPHTRYRRLVNRGFTPRMIGMLEPHIRDLTTRIVDEAMARGEVDFVVDVASELPLQVIAELMGVPHEDRHKIFEWSNRMIGSDDPEYSVSQEQVQQAQIEMFMFAQSLAEKRRAEPRDDIITKLLSADVDGDQLTEMDFNLFFLLLAVAGNETTRNAITHGMNAFLENPDQYERLVADPSLMDTAIEEILRWAIAGDVLPAQRHRGPGVQGPPASGRRQGGDLVRLGQPRRRRLRGSLPLRHRPPTQRPHPGREIRARNKAIPRDQCLRRDILRQIIRRSPVPRQRQGPYPHFWKEIGKLFVKLLRHFHISRCSKCANAHCTCG